MSEAHNYSERPTTELEYLMERLKLRAFIQKSLYSGKSLKEIIGDGRIARSEAAEEINLLANRYLSIELRAQKDVCLVLEELATYLREQFPQAQYLAIILLGSHAVRTSDIRAFFTNELRGDLDWGLLCSVDLDGDDIAQIIEKAKQKLFQLVEENRMHSSFSSCAFTNPKENVWKNLSDATDARDYLLSMISENHQSKPSLFRCGVAYFFPSFPRENNEKNKQLIIEALEKFSVDDHESCERIVHALLREWERTISAKPKHFASYLTFNQSHDEKLRVQAANLLSNLMKDAFSKLLMATDKGRAN